MIIDITLCCATAQGLDSVNLLYLLLAASVLHTTAVVSGHWRIGGAHSHLVKHGIEIQTMHSDIQSLYATIHTLQSDMSRGFADVKAVISGVGKDMRDGAKQRFTVVEVQALRFTNSLAITQPIQTAMQTKVDGIQLDVVRLMERARIQDLSGWCPSPYPLVNTTLAIHRTEEAR